MLNGMLPPLIFVAASGAALLAGNAEGVEESLPSEVRALVGMKIPDMEPSGKGGIPGWHSKRGTLLGKQRVGVEELYRGSTFIFLVSGLDETGKNRTVLGVQVLPLNLLSYYEKDGELMFTRHSKKYQFESLCYRQKGEIVVGLMRPERGSEDCRHTTKQIKRAWSIDEQSGRISEISTQGVSCSFMDAEYSCDPS